MKTKTHGLSWLSGRFFLVCAIGILSVWGLAYVSIPFFYWMDHVQRQAAAAYLFAFLCLCLGVVWLVAKLTNKL